MHHEHASFFRDRAWAYFSLRGGRARRLYGHLYTIDYTTPTQHATVDGSDISLR